MSQHNVKKKGGNLYVVKQIETEIEVDELLQEYENLAEDEQKLLNRLADIRKRKKEIKSMVDDAVDESGENEKNDIIDRLNQVDPDKGKPTQKRNFSQSQ